LIARVHVHHAKVGVAMPDAPLPTPVTHWLAAERRDRRRW
jgi:hypothetical protein